MTTRLHGVPMLGEGGERLTWILGSSRSGSTWLTRMTSEFDEVATIDDPHLGHHLGVWRPIPLAWATADEQPELRQLGDFKRAKRDYFFSEEFAGAWKPALRDLIDARFGAQVAADDRARGEPHSSVVVKEPASQVADLLVELFPRSRLIFLLRDGRDVVASWLDAYRAGTWAEEGGAYAVSDEGRLALVRWQAAVWLRRTEIMQRVFASHDPERRLMVRYGRLLADPVGEFSRVAKLVRADAPPGRIEEIAEKHKFDRVPFGRKGAGQEIRRAEPGSWRQTMSDDEIAAMHEVLNGKLAELGIDDVEQASRAA